MHGDQNLLRTGAGAGRIQGLYRWHLPDPIYFNEEIRVTMQQIAHKGSSPSIEAYLRNLREVEDDWCAATFWYEGIPSAPLPKFQGVKERTADLYREKK